MELKLTMIVFNEFISTYGAFYSLLMANIKTAGLPSQEIHYHFPLIEHSLRLGFLVIVNPEMQTLVISMTIPLITHCRTGLIVVLVSTAGIHEVPDLMAGFYF